MDGIAALKVSDIATLVPLGIALGLGAIFFWVILRTESWHMLRRRIWLLVHGKEEISDPGIRAYVDEQNNLAAFHVFAGVQVTTLAEARTLMEWCRVRNVDLGVLRICGPYFDPQARRVKERWLPPKWVGRAVGVCAMALMVTGLLAIWAMTLPALLTVKKTDQSFLASETELRPVWPLPPFSTQRLRPDDCEKPVAGEAARLGFSERDIATMCSVLKDPEFGVYVDKAIRKQWGYLALWAALFLSFAYYVAVAALRVVCARKLLSRRADPALPAAQLEIDFGAP
ncbi:DUF6216 family protein [Paracidovorax cattleyae]|uniref:Uncharacterized protein n=1 Tax=Paracidovorax cattleyae TaxID=80868 RepID=A0A1H0PCC8_9BURK|nr:DUF6216 family protein [Paracidovorax cattleyae]AVS76036.1 hypothetical protein C8240_20405 [Paracidovorax cattleyae]SDP02663.1 hypothetical protein SAMN04489708_10690 [Paracidovorax cattleyae]